ncbi:MAG: NADP-dependent isocitrate dehydrogenase [Alphaproteobacteria bacterium]|nr:NADP-dependent isocitrate dehydrogenase [Alphaproteobacteria bacterium]
MTNTTITVAYGDGIGPEIMEAVLLILKEAKAKIDIDTIEVGEELYKKGFSSGLTPEALKTIQRNKIFLKAPITTPQGDGYKSLNVTIRKQFGLYANLRPCLSLHPYVPTKHPDLDIVVVRENEEDLYAGVEYRSTRNVYQALKLISRTGSESIVKFAFDYAERNNRKKVTCLSKDNIMKFTDGIFHKVFDEISENYKNIESEHYILDIGTARVAARPENFDVLVTSNLYGDVISDVVAEICGSVGMSGSANIGRECAMFEAIHGSAPKMAGKNTANPSGLLNGAIMMLVHIGQPETAELIHNAWLKTIEDGMHTKDIYRENVSNTKLGTHEFAEEVVKRLGQSPSKLKPVKYNKDNNAYKDNQIKPTPYKENKELVGVDVFLDWQGKLDDLVKLMEKAANKDFRLHFISVRGLMVHPSNADIRPNISHTDHWRIRFFGKNDSKLITHKKITELLNNIDTLSIDFIKTENLYTYDGEIGFTLAQGE